MKTQNTYKKKKPQKKIQKNRSKKYKEKWVENIENQSSSICRFAKWKELYNVIYFAYAKHT